MSAWQRIADQGSLTTGVVFVYGALRSGTTLFRLMLEAHPGITNPGEADFLFDHIAPDPGHPTGWRYDLAGLRADRIFVDKRLDLPPGLEGLDLLSALLDQFSARAVPGQVVTLNLHRHLDRLMAAVPAARLIHILRDPRDVARSSIGMGWAGLLYYGADHWIDTETAWGGQVGHLAPGQFLELKYEEIFADIEAALRQVCAFLGVPYDPRMLDYHKSTTYGPPDASLVNQWQRLSSPREVQLLESRIAPLMQSRGYAPSGPPILAQPAIVAWLGLVNKALVWRFGVRRFGFILFIGEKLTRYSRLSALHRLIRVRIADINLHHLK